MKIYIVLPYYNEKKHIQGLIAGLLKQKFPVVVVDDGSSDNGVDASTASNVTIIKHRVNLGKGSAMKTGAEYAFAQGADAVIFMDSDGQHSLEDIKAFVSKLNTKKFDIIFGSRHLKKGVPMVRYFGKKLASVVVKVLFNVKISDPICGFRALTKNGYNKVRWNSTGYGVEVEMVARVGKYKVSYSEVPVKTIYHDHVKGVTMLDAFGILGEVVKWRVRL